MSSTSRSTSPYQSSPATPESTQPSDFMGEPVVQDGQQTAWVDLASAVSNAGQHHQSLSDIVDWFPKDIFAHPAEDPSTMLTLDDLIQEDAIEPSPTQPEPRSLAGLSQPMSVSSPAANAAQLFPHVPVPGPSTSTGGGSGNARILPREACQGLLIVVPNVPPSGAKSRVETQIRMELTLTTMSAFQPSDTWDRVASWPWLRLPKGSATKRRPRKDVHVQPPAHDVLDLSVDVICLSNPDIPVQICDSCKEREIKRKARKAASRVRPTKNDDDPDLAENSEPQMVHFNCPELVDFSSGVAGLPVRITCYCRHHKEKTGFSLRFSLWDADQRMVGTGTTPPVMITDDHKSNKLRTAVRETHSASADEDGPADNKQQGTVRGVGASQRSTDPKKRSKPYERDRKSRAVAPSSSPAVQPAVTPLQTGVYPTAPPSPSASPSLSFVASPSESAIFNALSPTALPHPFSGVVSPAQFSPPTPAQSQASSLPSTVATAATVPFQFPGIFSLPAPQLPPALPRIDRLIPASGPTHGGIEVIVRGANFDSATTFSCIFGGTRALATERWGDTVLRCILPPRAIPGVVAVTLERVEGGNVVTEEHDLSTAGSVFTYVEESDRALMELALQVVGLKMNGKIEEAKTVALRIFRSISTDTPMEGDVSNITMLATDPQQLLLHYGKVADLQTAIINLLSSYFPESEDAATSSSLSPARRKALSHRAPSGQTLLHLATILNMPELVGWLLSRTGTEVNAQDLNGFTALHFAVLAGARECAAKLFRAGADRTMRTRAGLTPAQLAGDWVSDLVGAETRDASDADADDEDWQSDEEASDAESFSEGSPTLVPTSPTLSSMTRRRRPRVTSGSESSDGEHESGDLDDRPTPALPPASAPPAANEKALGWLQKLANLQPPPGIIPNVPVPWDWAQIPVFYVPVPAWMWPSDDKRGEKVAAADGAQTAQQAQSAWERWTPQLLSPRLSFTRPVPQEPTDEAAAQQQQQQHNYPPAPAAAPAQTFARVARSVGYVPASVADAEMNSYGVLEAKPRRSGKQDRMLMWFWLPILLLGLTWVLFTGVPVAYNTLGRAFNTVLPLRNMLRVPAA